MRPPVRHQPVRRTPADDGPVGARGDRPPVQRHVREHVAGPPRGIATGVDGVPVGTHPADHLIAQSPGARIDLVLIGKPRQPRLEIECRDDSLDQALPLALGQVPGDLFDLPPARTRAGIETGVCQLGGRARCRGRPRRGDGAFVLSMTGLPLHSGRLVWLRGPVRDEQVIHRRVEERDRAGPPGVGGEQS